MKKVTICGLLLLLILIWWMLRPAPDVETHQGSSETKSSPKRDVLATPPSPSDKSQANSNQLAGFKAAFETPIDFYGKVVDQHGDPIPNASIRYSVLTFTGKKTQRTAGKDDGSFAITGEHGGTLAVEVSKTGFRTIPGADDKVGSAKLFYFGLGNPPSSSPNSPIKFTLHRPGPIEPLLHVEERNYRLARDGSPVEVGLHPEGKHAHRVILRCWNKELEPRPQGEHRYDWRLEIEVSDGGIVERKNSLAFEAPPDGYNPKAVIEMPVDVKPIWSRSAQRSYFIRFHDNQFALVKLEMIAGGDHFVVWESYLNPKPGSRHLDTDP